ncbi:hypothetical protein LXA43DRAFT_694297 [Ganoderma leucocontextum]|nr:hypothetical protein LXA43DRAFT_694297 [Ganoderma leucocontextum]
MSLRRHIVGTYSTYVTLDPADLVALLFDSYLHPFSPTRPSTTMTESFDSQNDKNTTSTKVSVDTGILGPPQEEKSVPKPPAKRDLSWLLPPQEEMIDVARARGEKARIDSSTQIVDRLEERINKHRIEYTPPRTIDEMAEQQVLRGAVFSGVAGVTGEDFCIVERHRLVRRKT